MQSQIHKMQRKAAAACLPGWAGSHPQSLTGRWDSALVTDWRIVRIQQKGRSVPWQGLEHLWLLAVQLGSAWI